MINTTYKYGLLAALLLCTVGCTFQHSLKSEETIEAQKVYPTINLVVSSKSDWVTRQYIEYLKEIKTEFIKDNKFTVSSNNNISPYTIEIVHGATDKRSHPQMIWWTITAFSLFIIPSQLEMEHTMDINIFLNGALIKQYTYKDAVTGWTTLFSSHGYSAGDVHTNVLSKFYNDIHRDNIFNYGNDKNTNNGIKI